MILKEAAEKIAVDRKVPHETVMHMFYLIKLNADQKTNITKDDLEQFRMKWDISLKDAGLLLAECIAYALPQS